VATRRSRLPLALCALALATSSARADELGTALYVRTDDDDTTVVSPRARAQKSFGESTDLEATYAADVWTSASIDIRTSASVREVTEQRDELDVGVTHALEDLTLHAGYRLSLENDYDSNGLSASGSYDFADNAANLTLSVNAIHDRVGRSGDPDFARALDTLNTRLSFTQVIDPEMFAQLVYEPAFIFGYQASPYRYVGFGGTGYGCVGAQECLPEQVPDSRIRHAIAVALRRALTDAFSLGLTYRFYFDDWGLSSHTALVEAGLTLGEDTLLALRYRFYVQGEVDFYKVRYGAQPANQDYYTRDRELSKTSSHRLSLELEQVVHSEPDGKSVSFSLALAGARFRYDDFVGLSSTLALEVTAACVLKL